MKIRIPPIYGPWGQLLATKVAKFRNRPSERTLISENSSATHQTESQINFSITILFSIQCCKRSILS